MNFKLGELEKLFYNIEDIVDYVERSQICSNNTKIYLGNNEKINLVIPKESIPHLLGIDTSYLDSTKIFGCTNSFELLKKLIEDPYKINKLHNEDILNYNSLFSSHILKKIEDFKENIKINIYETEFVCKYNSTKSYMITDKSEKYDYIIIKKYSDGKIGVLGLIKNNYNYVIRSNQIFLNYEEFENKMKDTLTNQELTIISGIKIYNEDNDYNRNFLLNLETKEQKVIKLLYYKKELNASIDVSGDYIHNIGILGTEKNHRYKQVDTIDYIIKQIINGKIINQDTIEDDNLLKICEAYNDLLCKESINDNDIQVTYNEAIKKLKEFEMLVKSLNNKISNLEQENEELQIQNKELINQNNENTETINNIIGILKPRM